MDHQQEQPASQQPPQPQSPAESTPPKPRLNLWILSTLALLILLAAVSIYTLTRKPETVPTVPQPTTHPSPQPTPTPLHTQDTTEKWKTYINLDHRFKFKYPNKWGILEEWNWISSSPGMTNPLDCLGNSSTEFVCVSFTTGSGYYTMYGHTVHRDPDDKKALAPIERDIDIYYEDRALDVYIPTKPVAGNIIWLHFEGFTQDINYQDTEKSDIFNQILSTFQFLDE